MIFQLLTINKTTKIKNSINTINFPFVLYQALNDLSILSDTRKCRTPLCSQLDYFWYSFLLSPYNS